ncbi:MAG: molybdopterin cofactor-binding domain-containing protein, partial [Pseudomonadota bacterium]|nr:molybdopterin cofactor-binding domain-containing protein [Pseudomonadota bacterium]
MTRTPPPALSAAPLRPEAPDARPLPASGAPLNVSRRAFLGGAGALTLAVALPGAPARAQSAAAADPAPQVAAFLELRADGAALLRSPFVEGGQGIATAMAQIVGEELDLPPDRFEVVNAPAGDVYRVMGGMRITGGSMSVRRGGPAMRRLGAAARAMLIAAAAERLGVDPASLTTEPGRVVHAASGRALDYAALAEAAAALPAPADAPLRDPAAYRWVGQPVDRLDVRDKSTGRAVYGIDLAVDGMLLAAVRHAPRRGLVPGALANRAEVEATPGVHSVQVLP